MTRLSIPQKVYQMNLYDVVLATLVVKSPPDYFREKALAYGFREVVGADPEMEQRLFLPGVHKMNGNGSVSGLERVILQMQLFHVLETNGSGQLYFPDAFKPVNLRGLRQRYGSGVQEILRPFTEAVWEAAARYPIPVVSVDDAVFSGV